VSLGTYTSLSFERMFSRKCLRSFQFNKNPINNCRISLCQSLFFQNKVSHHIYWITILQYLTIFIESCKNCALPNKSWLLFEPNNSRFSLCQSLFFQNRVSYHTSPYLLNLAKIVHSPIKHGCYLDLTIVELALIEACFFKIKQENGRTMRLCPFL